LQITDSHFWCGARTQPFERSSPTPVFQSAVPTQLFECSSPTLNFEVVYNPAFCTHFTDTHFQGRCTDLAFRTQSPRQQKAPGRLKDATEGFVAVYFERRCSKLKSRQAAHKTDMKATCFLIDARVKRFASRQKELSAI
jgi:hypothetical protein